MIICQGASRVSAGWDCGPVFGLFRWGGRLDLVGSAQFGCPDHFFFVVGFIIFQEFFSTNRTRVVHQIIPEKF